jgi:hypothetical protein
MHITDDELLNPNITNLPSKDEVIALIALYRKKGSSTNHLVYNSSDGRRFFIKYGNVIMAEARTQLYFFNRISTRPDITIHIPEIYHAFISRATGDIS